MRVPSLRTAAKQAALCGLTIVKASWTPDGGLTVELAPIDTKKTPESDFHFDVEAFKKLKGLKKTPKDEQ